MNLSQAVKAQHLFVALRKVRALHSEQRYEDSLKPIREALFSAELQELDAHSDLRCQFRFLEAVALDMTGKTESALEILAGLVKKFPGVPQYEESLQICCLRLEDIAARKLQVSPSDPDIKKILEICQQFGFASYWLIHAVAAQEVAEGKVQAAWKRTKDLLALSPNDEDYLRCALAIAAAPELHRERSQLLAHLRRLWEAYPYRLELAELLCANGDSGDELRVA